MWRNGEQVTGFISEKALALLVYLAVTEETHARDYLTGLLWGDTAESKAKSSLRSALYNLGQLLPDLLDVTRKTVALAENVESDVAQLRAGDPTVHTADFLAGFYINHSPEFEMWQLRQREQLRGLAIAAWRAQATQLEGLEQWEAAVAAWQALIHLESWRERPHRQIMLIYGRLGAFDSALNQYKQCRAFMIDELGIESTGETTSLAEQIMRARTQPRHNLPKDSLPFLGRKPLLEEIGQRLQKDRLVTLVGLGGMGKTRLAIAVAEQRLQSYLHGVAFVSLIGINANGDARHAVATTIMRTLTDTGMLPHTHEDAEVYLLDQLARQEMLLVLDNFELLLEAAPFLADLLKAAPQLRLLVTSRERLWLQQEYVVWVDGLERETAVSLFTQTAQRVSPSFQPDEHVLQICEQVDGMPLAIELAASWMDAQTPAQIATELATSLSPLQDDALNRPARHRSIHYLFEQAWHRLDDAQQEMIICLTQFQESFTAEAVAEIASATREDIRLLINRSLLQRSGQRFRLHPLMSQFLAEKGGVDADVMATFTHYYLQLFEDAGQRALQGVDGDKISSILPDMHNFALAWHWAITNAPLALEEMAACFHLLFADRGLDEWVLQLVNEALTTVPDTDELQRLRLRLQLEQAYLLFWYKKEYATTEQRLQSLLLTLTNYNELSDFRRELAYCYTLLGWYHHYYHQDLPVAETNYEHAYALWCELGNVNNQASRLLDLGNIAFAREQWAAAEAYWGACAACSLAVGNDVGHACAQFSLGRVAIVTHRWTEAEGLLAEVRATLAHHHGLNISWHGVMGLLAALHELYAEAEQWFEAQLEICWQYGRIDHTINAYCNLGRVAKVQGQERKAERFFKQAEQLCQRQNQLELLVEIENARQQLHFDVNEA